MSVTIIFVLWFVVWVHSYICH